MSEFFVVVEDIAEWQPYFPSQDVISFDQYLSAIEGAKHKRVRVINLCHNYRYLSVGYYCSLLAEAREHHVFPSVTTINDLGKKSLTSIQLEPVKKILDKLPAKLDHDIITFKFWFGQTNDSRFEQLAQAIFERFPCPLLSITVTNKKSWQVKSIKAISLQDLSTPQEQEAFAEAFEKFSIKMWRKPKARKSFRYDLAILVDPNEELPPSDSKALKKFQKTAAELGVATDLITRTDYIKLAEYDGLFIRETTSVDHHTYKFAKKAEAEGLVVIDDPTSILRCTNKVYLADLLKAHNIPTPKTKILKRVNKWILEDLVESMGFPIVLKIPDGSFSKGIIKVETYTELELAAKKLLAKSALLLAQEFLYTQYDWRIGVLNNKPLYACRYYMVNNHWQIYQHGEGEVLSGEFDTLPTFETPKKVLDVAIQATKLIGDGLYGVDLKQADDEVVVIEVNDNPSIESGVEDKYLGDQLYREIISEFLRRMEARGR